MTIFKNNPLKEFICLAGFVTGSIFTVFPAIASEGLTIVFTDSGSGSFACLNNTNAACKNSSRDLGLQRTDGGGFACLNNPNATCNTPPRTVVINNTPYR